MPTASTASTTGAGCWVLGAGDCWARAAGAYRLRTNSSQRKRSFFACLIVSFPFRLFAFSPFPLLPQSFQEVVADPQRIRHDGQCRVYCAARWEETCVNNVKIVQ